MGYQKLTQLVVVEFQKLKTLGHETTNECSSILV